MSADDEAARQAALEAELCVAEAEVKAGREAALDALRDAHSWLGSPGPGAARLVWDMLDGHAQAMDSIEPDAARALRPLARVVAASGSPRSACACTTTRGERRCR